MSHPHTLVAELDHPAYHERVKLPGYNGKTTVFQAVTDRDAAHVLRRVNPAWTKEQHLELAQRHAGETLRQREAWNKLLNEAAQQTFGRPFQFFDYRISGIGRDEFSEEHKVALRFHAHATTYHEQVSRAHAHAARYFH